MLRGLWIFHAESDVRLLMSRRFPTVEKKMQRLLGEDYVALPCDEDINLMFITEILHEEEDHYIPPGIPEPFHEDFQQGSFSWNEEQEAHAEKRWPMGPISSICKGKIWPVLFLFKKGFYLVTVVGLEKKYKIEQVRALELPQITAAFSVLEDVCDFIPANLTISDVAGISELQYYIRSAIPFGSPVNTNYHLLRMVRHGFANKEDDITQRSPAWKPYLYKGKSKLTLLLVEMVNCTLYGKPEYEDECFIAGTVYCCADISGIPEICVPISYHNDQGAPPEISVHNCAHVVGGLKAAKEDSFKISCVPPTGPFVLCRYRYAKSPIIPVRGFYQIKEMSPVEFRLLLQIQLHPVVGSAFWSCQVRLPFHHRGVIKSHDLKCTGGSFALTDHGQSILWNLNVRRPRGNFETNLLGELIFEAPQPADSEDGGTTTRTIAAPGPGIGTAASNASGPQSGLRSLSLGDLGGGAPLPGAGGGPPQPGAGGALMVNRGGSAVIIGSTLTPSGGLMYANPHGSCAPESQAARSAGDGGSRRTSSQLSAEALDKRPLDFMSGERSGSRSGEGNDGAGGGSASRSVSAASPVEERGNAKDVTQDDRSGKSGGQQQPLGGFVQDPFLHGVNCYAEVFLEVPDATLSGITVDPKAVTVYPTTRVYGGVSVQKEVLTGKYTIWNMAGEVRGHHAGLDFGEDDMPMPLADPLPSCGLDE